MDTDTATADSATVPLQDGAVLYAAAGSAAIITLNRPEVLNAINAEVHLGLIEALDRAGRDESIRSAVIRGSGRAFCAGGDLKATAAGTHAGHPSAVGRAIWNLPKPVIAAVHGYCLGQACEIAGVCDFTVAAKSAKFGEVEINHGWGPPIPITPFAAGLKQAKEVLLLGEIFDADRAQQFGLVNRVVDDEDLEAEVARMTDRIAGLAAEAVADNKRLINSRYEAAGFLTVRGYGED